MHSRWRLQRRVVGPPGSLARWARRPFAAAQRLLPRSFLPLVAPAGALRHRSSLACPGRSLPDCCLSGAALKSPFDPRVTFAIAATLRRRRARLRGKRCTKRAGPLRGRCDGATACWRLAILRNEASTGALSARFTACPGDSGTNYRRRREMIIVARCKPLSDKEKISLARALRRHKE